MRIENLCKTYQIKKTASVNALSHIALDLPETGMVFILGKSGSGKSTLLKLLAGLEAPTEGEIYFHGKDLAKCSVKELDSYRNTYCGFIFQEYNLIPELNVGDNIALALQMQGEKETKEKVEEVLRQVDLEGYEKRRVSELSGGQRQRIAIARAIIKNPEIIFADEPTGALDQKTGNAVFSLLKELSKEHLILAVTHDRDFAEQYGDRIIELQDGEIVGDTQSSTPTPASEEEETPYEIKKTKLPFKTAVKVGSGTFQFHPLRTVVAVVLSSILFSIFAACLSFAFLTKTSLSVGATFDAHLKETLVFKKDQDGNMLSMTKDDLDFFEENYPGRAFQVLESRIKIEEDEKSNVPFYSLDPFGYALIDQVDLDPSYQVIGHFPENESEVMITKFTAEKLLFLKGEGELSSLLEQEITLDEATFTISAILDTGLDERPYLALKEKGGGDELFGEFFDHVFTSRHNFIYLSKRGDVETCSHLSFEIEGLSRRDLKAILSQTQDGAFYALKNAAADDTSEIGSLIEGLRGAIYALSIGCCLFSLAIFLYFVTQSISYQTELIMLLRLLGLDKGNISRIFLCETFLLGLMVFVLSISGCASIYLLLNRFLLSGLTLFQIDWIETLLLIAVDIICILSGTTFPLRKLKNCFPRVVE